MTATAHALVSGAIAAAVPNPFLAAGLAFFSHFLMDAVPHWDIGTNWRERTKAKTGSVAVLDTLLGFTLAYFLFAGKAGAGPVLMAAVMGNLPDWLEAPYYIFFARTDKKEPAKTAGFWEMTTWRVYKMENVFHTKAAFPFGVVTQVITVAFFLLLLSVASGA